MALYWFLVLDSAIRVRFLARKPGNPSGGVNDMAGRRRNEANEIVGESLYFGADVSGINGE